MRPLYSNSDPVQAGFTIKPVALLHLHVILILHPHVGRSLAFSVDQLLRRLHHCVERRSMRYPDRYPRVGAIHDRSMQNTFVLPIAQNLGGRITCINIHI